MFNKKSYKKNAYQLTGSLKYKGYDWWWHSFTGYNHKTGKEKPFYVEFFIINPGLCPDKVILGQSKKAKDKNWEPCYLMVNVGTWGNDPKQLHRFFPINEMKLKKCPIEIEADDCYLSETELRGSVKVEESNKANMSDVGSMEWNLKIDKKIAWNVGYGTCGLFRKLKAFEMYWHSNGMKSLFEGSVTLDGEVYDVIPEKSYGYSDKNWGKNFTSPWVWISSNNIVRKSTGEKLENSVFDIGGGKPKAFGIKFDRKLLAAYYIEGKEIEMNFSKFLSNPCNTWFKESEDKDKIYWRVIQENSKYRIETDVSCLKKEMLLINYEAPDGTKRHNKLWNGGNGVGNMKIYRKLKKKNRKDKNQPEELVEDLLFYNTGCEYGEFDK